MTTVHLNDGRTWTFGDHVTDDTLYHLATAILSELIRRGKVAGFRIKLKVDR